MPFGMLPAFLRTGILLPSTKEYGESSYFIKDKNNEIIVHGVHVYDEPRAHWTRRYCPYQKLFVEDMYYSLAIEVRTDSE
eukprot:4691587-Prorocentrum_lima.AAC.1